MSETKYNADQIKALMKANPFFRKKETEKYARYKSIDPFPHVGEALLNSVDLLMYLLMVGIVEPFDVDKLKGVTYQCSFSGEAHRFDLKTGKMEESNLSNNEELTLEPNSITYLKIEERFHVPEYMVLRFNLSVSNAYKGLLLGTGPIVDPGFEGNLFIPLHNLTGNQYIIKEGASLIRVEFTKLSRHVDWHNKKKNLFPPLKPITKNTPRNAKFSKFFEDALLDPDKKMFYTKGSSVSVRSSIPDAISAAADKADEAQRSAASAASTAEEMEKSVRKWSIFGAVGGVIAVASLMISVFALIQDANARYDGIVQELQDANARYDSVVQELQDANARYDTMVQEMGDFGQELYTLSQELEISQKKLEQYEAAHHISSGQVMDNPLSDRTAQDAFQVSGKTGSRSGEQRPNQ